MRIDLSRLLWRLLSHFPYRLLFWLSSLSVPVRDVAQDSVLPLFLLHDNLIWSTDAAASPSLLSPRSVYLTAHYMAALNPVSPSSLSPRWVVLHLLCWLICYQTLQEKPGGSWGCHLLPQHLVDDKSYHFSLSNL